MYDFYPKKNNQLFTKYNIKTIPQPKNPSAQGFPFAMKKLLFPLAICLLWGQAVLAQNKFKTVKRSADVVVENPSPIINEEPENRTLSRQKYLSKPSDNQTYMNLISKKSGLKIIVDENRSEERRGGKEC